MLSDYWAVYSIRFDNLVLIQTGVFSSMLYIFVISHCNENFFVAQVSDKSNFRGENQLTVFLAVYQNSLNCLLSSS